MEPDAAAAADREPQRGVVDFDLGGRVALVTGASRGIGRDLALALAARGCRVALAARHRSKLEETAACITDRGGIARAVHLDLANEASIDAAIAEAEDQLGPLSTLVNNGGLAISKPLVEQTAEDWDAVVDTNLRGAFLTSRAAAKRMIAHGIAGSIINIASVMGFGVIGQLAPYAASKAGLVQLTRAMALELARHRIRVNAIAPGYIETDMTRDFFVSDEGQRLIRSIPQRRLGRTDDLVGALLLLASDASSYMTGSTLVVDGGFLLS